jgi:hypothetical protein
VSADYIVSEAEHVDIMEHSQHRFLRVTRELMLGSGFSNFYVVVDCVLGILGVAFF